MKVIFLFPYPLEEAPSQRFRFEQYFAILKTKHIIFSCHSFWSKKGWKILYSPKRNLLKLLYFLMGWLNRFLILFKIPFVDFVFVHRECLPVGPPVIEWVIAKVLRKKIIYDFDDAIWLPNTSSENGFAAIMKWHSKVGAICKWSYKVSCGNEYLSEFAQRYNRNVTVNPTTVDTEHLHNPSLYKIPEDRNKIIIGWTGTHSTLKYLEFLVPIIQKLETQFNNFQFLIIANKRPSIDLKSMAFLPWSKENEMEDLMKFDVGVMPLSEDIWSFGKCGFKALQYMALEIPTIASPVGVNTKIIDHGLNGFLCSSEQEWFVSLSNLILNSALRKQIGIEGRKKVITNYSVSSNSSKFVSLFE